MKFYINVGLQMIISLLNPPLYRKTWQCSGGIGGDTIIAASATFL
jgi:hypothetical protein